MSSYLILPTQYFQICISGAADFPTPHITPRSSLTDDSSVVNFVTKDGLVVCLPHNSKINFARHIILNSIMNLKRYETLQTFTDTSILHHPKKEYVCVLDIVTCDPGKNLVYVRCTAS